MPTAPSPTFSFANLMVACRQEFQVMRGSMQECLELSVSAWSARWCLDGQDEGDEGSRRERADIAERLLWLEAVRIGHLATQALYSRKQNTIRSMGNKTPRFRADSHVSCRLRAKPSRTATFSIRHISLSCILVPYCPPVVRGI